LQVSLQVPVERQLVVPLLVVGQGVHWEPQLLTLVFDEQVPLQL
jgi:hypothetical protein